MPTITWEVDQIVVGGTYTFTANVKRDGSAVDLTGGAVYFYLKDPSGNISNSTATITNATAGIASFTSNTSIFDEHGDWERRWTAVLANSAVYPFSWRTFPVYRTD